MLEERSLIHKISMLKIDIRHRSVRDEFRERLALPTAIEGIDHEWAAESFREKRLKRFVVAGRNFTAIPELP